MVQILYKCDLPDNYSVGNLLAVDTETMGLNVFRDRLCVVQLSRGDGSADIVQIARGQNEAPNLSKILSDPGIVKIFHYARADLAALKQWLGIDVEPVYCTKIASRFARTNAQQHGLKALIHELLGVEIQKEQQSSDWGVDELSQQQLQYAASDVLYLHKIKEQLDDRLIRDGYIELAQKCFEFLPHRVKLDLYGWKNDIFAH